MNRELAIIFYIAAVFIIPTYLTMVMAWRKGRNKIYCFFFCILGMGWLSYFFLRNGTAPCKCPVCKNVVGLGLVQCNHCNMPLAWPCPVCNGCSTEVIKPPEKTSRKKTIQVGIALIIMGCIGMKSEARCDFSHYSVDVVS